MYYRKRFSFNSYLHLLGLAKVKEAKNDQTQDGRDVCLCIP
jgi:hypothetical protein